jgi:hypothetical protein
MRIHNNNSRKSGEREAIKIERMYKRTRRKEPKVELLWTADVQWIVRDGVSGRVE